MIEFSNVKKSFAGRPVLKGISFKIKKGEIAFILGTSGTGKSVTLKNIVGLIRPDDGEIFIDGQEVSHLSEEDYFPIRKKCGMVFQHPALFDSMTIFENVAFGLRRQTDFSESQIREKVIDALTLVNLPGIEDKMPNEISYGMQKRVSLARTLAIDPKTLLFDEPTTSLDPMNTNAINQLIFHLSRYLQITSVVVSHDMKCALAIADKIIMLDKGEVVEEGTPEQMKKSRHPLICEFLSEALEAHV